MNVVVAFVNGRVPKLAIVWPADPQAKTTTFHLAKRGHAAVIDPTEIGFCHRGRIPTELVVGDVKGSPR